MYAVTDLHLHSKYSRAVSQQMTLPMMAQIAAKKGIDVLTTSDWTHPLWFKEIKEQLTEISEGIYSLKPENQQQSSSTSFLLSTEISSIYKQGEKLRRIHNLLFVPNLETAEKVTMSLLAKGANLSADGRPIIGLSSRNLLELILETDERAMLIPCHIWTPHFGIYGSASGFDSLEEAFGDLSQYVYGVETGLSSDPEMNWQIPELSTRTILSFSDAHSPSKMGREATVMELEEVTYNTVRDAIMRPSRLASEGELSNTNRVLYTIEFYPEEGKYHFSGHRTCKISYGPEEIAEKGTICPVCRKRLTEGVMLRVQTLAGQSYAPKAIPKRNDYGLVWQTDKKHTHPSFVKLVPLLEIVAESLESTTMSQKTKQLYDRLLNEFGSEMEILLKTPIDNLRSFAGDRLGESVQKVREGNIEIIPGYDGEYGIVKIWKDGEDVSRKTEATQMSLL